MFSKTFVPFFNTQVSSVPIGLQPLCRGDGLGPKPLGGLAVVPWGDVAPRPPSPPVSLHAPRWLHFHRLYFSLPLKGCVSEEEHQNNT